MADVMGDIEATVNNPLLTTPIDPLCDVTELLKLIAAPFKLIAVASSVPLIVVVPVADTIVKGPE